MCSVNNVKKVMKSHLLKLDTSRTPMCVDCGSNIIELINQYCRDVYKRQVERLYDVFIY